MKKQHELIGISLEEFVKRQKAVEKFEQERIDALIRLESKYYVKWAKKKK